MNSKFRFKKEAGIYIMPGVTERWVCPFCGKEIDVAKEIHVALSEGKSICGTHVSHVECALENVINIDDLMECIFCG